MQAASGNEGVQMLVVPASAWYELQATVKELKRSLSESKRYSKAVLRLEYQRRERAARRVQAAARGFMARCTPAGREVGRRMRSRPWLAPLPECAHVTATAFRAAPQRGTDVTWILQTAACLRISAVARGALVRQRLRRYRRQHAAAARVQAVSRGAAARRAHAHARSQHVRLLALERTVAAETRARRALEAALRTLWQDFGALREALAAGAKEAPQESPPPRGASPIELLRMLSPGGAEARNDAGERRGEAAARALQASWRQHGSP